MIFTARTIVCADGARGLRISGYFHQIPRSIKLWWHVTAQPLALHALACALCTSFNHRYTLARVVVELTLSSRLVHILTVAKLPLRRMQWWSGTRECLLRIVWVSRCSILVQNKYTGSTVGQQIHSRSKGAANFVLFRKLWFLCFFAHVARLRQLCGVRLAGILISQQQWLTTIAPRK
jgi:hypothetical protein